jgi:predicted metalloprotease
MCDANELSVRLELQADSLAGVWAFSSFERELLEVVTSKRGLPRPQQSGMTASSARRVGK